MLLHKVRTSGQLVLLMLALFLIVHGIWGPQFAPKNLTTILLWVHYRGFLVLALLFVGNIFCMVCPMMLVRDWMRRQRMPTRAWPQWLKNKYPACIFFVGVLFLYEWLDFWAKPLSSGLLILGVFIVAVTIDIIYKRASFCKYVCPVGQFNFLASALSPTQVQKKKSAVCESCTTHDCLHGNAGKKGTGSYGCELDLFVATKIGNMDCTLCLECVVACPHDNIELGVAPIGRELFHEENRSGLGNLGRRHDYAILVIIFTFGALLNAFGMVGPAYSWQEDMALWLGLPYEGLTLAIVFVLFLFIAPLVLLMSARTLSRLFLPTEYKNQLTIRRMIASFVPLGFGVWLSHYLFHLLTGALTFLPLIGIAIEPTYMGLPVKIVMPMQFAIIIITFFFSLWVQKNILEKSRLPAGRILGGVWGFVLLLLSVFALWIFTLPMEMRGTFLGGAG